MTLAEQFRAEALREIDAQIDRLRASLDLAAAQCLPEASFQDIVLCGREAQLTIFRQQGVPAPGLVLVTAQLARHSLGGVTSLLFEKGLVLSPNAPARDATDDELKLSRR